MTWSEWPTDLLERAEVDSHRAVAFEIRYEGTALGDPDVLRHERERLVMIQDELLRRSAPA